MADPQIMVSFDTAPGELPRSIALERKRREIASIDFVQMFSEFIETSQTKNSKQPLELFDDEMFETKTLKSWFEIAKTVEIFDANKNTKRKVKGLYSSCYINGKWLRCIVIGQKKQDKEEYDDRLLVQIRDEKESKFWIPRLYVFIWGEDPRTFLDRLKNAKEQRDEVESLIRY